MGIILGLLSAICWGAADFLARNATRFIGTYRTVFYMQFIGLFALSLYLFTTGTFAQLISAHNWQPWIWALLTALLNVVSTLALYRSFEIGVLAIVSPIAASSAALTVVLSVMSGETISQQRSIGIVAALIGVVLAATSFSATTTAEAKEQKARLTRGVGWALLASIGYGLLFWLFGFQVDPYLGPIVPVWLVRLVTILTLALCARPLRQSIALPRGNVWWYISIVAILDTVAFICATFGLNFGQVAIVSVLVSLFSAVTVILAWIFLRERLHWSQWLGICIIFVALVLVNL